MGGARHVSRLIIAARLGYPWGLASLQGHWQAAGGTPTHPHPTPRRGEGGWAVSMAQSRGVPDLNYMACVHCSGPWMPPGLNASRGREDGVGKPPPPLSGHQDCRLGRASPSGNSQDCGVTLSVSTVPHLGVCPFSGVLRLPGLPVFLRSTKGKAGTRSQSALTPEEGYHAVPHPSLPTGAWSILETVIAQASRWGTSKGDLGEG